MKNKKNISVITTEELHTQIHELDDHTILTIILDSPEGAPADAES